MKLKTAAKLLALSSLGSQFASANQLYLEDASTLHDDGHEASDGVSCSELVLQIKRSLQDKADVQCAAQASRESEWGIECFRPTMNEHLLHYVFARVGASFGCSSETPNFGFAGEESTLDVISPKVLGIVAAQADGFTGTRCHTSGGHIKLRTCCHYENGRRGSCTTD